MEIIDEKFNWCNYNWLTREGFGSIHPNKSWVWYDPSSIEDGNNGEIILKVQKHNKTFAIMDNNEYIPTNGLLNTYNDLPTKNKEGDKYIVYENDSISKKLYMWNYENKWIDIGVVKNFLDSPNGVGIMCSEKEFDFGKFEIEAILPTGYGMWPAFWMYSSVDWPPEIDIFEGYSENNNYVRTTCLSKIRKYKVQSCLHYRDEWKIKSESGAMSPETKFFNGNPSETFNKYGLLWSDKTIEFYINDSCVRKITDKKALSYLSNYKMMVLINAHIDGFYKDTFSIGDPFIIKYFKYTPLSEVYG